MDRKAIYRKTALGLAEITTANRTVERRLRPLLILTDGNRTAAHVHSLTSAIGIREDDFDLLVAGGFIEAIARPQLPAVIARAGQTAQHWPAVSAQPRSDFERYSDGKRYFCESATEQLGVMAFLFVLKVEKCSSVEDLMALLPEFERTMTRKVDKDFAKRCARIAETILKK